MEIIHIGAELAPFAKVGGLADVLSGLCQKLSQKGHNTTVILPKYDCMDSKEIARFELCDKEFSSFWQGKQYSNRVWKGMIGDLHVCMIDSRHPHAFFNRGCIYGCDDDLDRCLYFCRAAFDYLISEGRTPDIIHTHDWQTAAVSLLPRIGRAQHVFTIHNMEYQGWCHPFDLAKIGVKESLGINNLLKAAIIHSDFVTTVSPTYAQEIMTSDKGFGLQETLLEHRNKFVGILNGIDDVYWNPERDPCLPAHYSGDDPSFIEKKTLIKRDLRSFFRLKHQEKPLVGCITRLVPQKGIKLIKHALFHTLQQGGQFVLLGSSPDPAIQREFEELRDRFGPNSDAELVLGYDEKLAHGLYGGTDMLIVPSIFEPCGLTQMIAMRYGTVPIVRKTGGLADTVHDGVNGYVFEEASEQGMESALDRAISCWYQNPGIWKRFAQHGLSSDFSWNRSADAYLDLYRSTRDAGMLLEKC